MVAFILKAGGSAEPIADNTFEEGRMKRNSEGGDCFERVAFRVIQIIVSQPMGFQSSAFA